jgi:hypothetical protein
VLRNERRSVAGGEFAESSKQMKRVACVTISEAMEPWRLYIFGGRSDKVEVKECSVESDQHIFHLNLLDRQFAI